MNDTETRLRDYLDSKAATIPDNHEAPGLDAPSHHRRSWPVVLAAAAIAAIVVAAIPVAIHLSGKDKTPPPPAEKPSNELRIPYVTSVDTRYPTQDKSAPTLHDGKQTATSVSTFATYYGRVGGGWLTDKPNEGRPTQAGLLMPDGSFRPLGPLNSTLAVPSPDRQQIVTSLQLGNHKTKVIVTDVATGKEATSITVPHQMIRLFGWNKDGIWFGEDYNVKAQPMVWQPGAGQPIQLSIPNFSVSATAPPETDKVLVNTTVAGKLCLEVGTLAGNKFDVIRRYCPKAGASGYPVLSPDGRTIISSEQKVAIDVATGKVTKLQLAHDLQGYPEPVFEDATHLITLPAPLAAGPGGRGIIPPGTPKDANGIPLIGAPVYRCDVTTGSCAHVFTTEPRINIDLAAP
jgi:hypothetical protein